MKKRGITIYLTEKEIEAFKEASNEQDRNMASQGAVLIKKFILNSKRKQSK